MEKKKSKLLNFLLTDIRFINSYLLLGIISITVIVLCSISYALFSYERISPNTISLVVGSNMDNLTCYNGGAYSSISPGNEWTKMDNTVRFGGNEIAYIEPTADYSVVISEEEEYRGRTRTGVSGDWGNWTTDVCDTSDNINCLITKGFLKQTRTASQEPYTYNCEPCNYIGSGSDLWPGPNSCPKGTCYFWDRYDGNISLTCKCKSTDIGQEVTRSYTASGYYDCDDMNNLCKSNCSNSGYSSTYSYSANCSVDTTQIAGCWATASAAANYAVDYSTHVFKRTGANENTFYYSTCTYTCNTCSGTHAVYSAYDAGIYTPTCGEDELTKCTSLTLYKTKVGGLAYSEWSNWTTTECAGSSNFCENRTKYTYHNKEWKWCQ